MKNEKKENAPLIQKEISTLVLARIEQFTSTGELVLPKDYSAANALRGAMLVLEEAKDRSGKPVLQSCTKASVSMSLLKMVVEGLSVIKKQGYFIPYGDQLQWSRSYQGSIALAKRVGGVKDVVANVVYQDDEFAFDIDTLTGYKKIVKHDQSLANIDNSKISGAYAVVIYEDGRTDLEVMTIKEIDQAWKQGATKGNSPAHQNFAQEMAKKTVINRACKSPINSSSDANLSLTNNEETDDETFTEDVTHEVLNETASVLIEDNPKDEEENEEPKY
jgi:recombination protein RecT